jgi:hypothetical protein
VCNKDVVRVLGDRPVLRAPTKSIQFVLAGLPSL